MRAFKAWPAAKNLYTPSLALICLLAAVLRLHTLPDANPWWDEGFTFWLASQDLPGMLLRTASDTHPPLSYFLYQLWMPLAGRGIYALRFQAVLFGVLGAPVSACVARRVGGPVAGVLAAVLVAISPFHIWWSQQIRMYALVALLCALSIYFLVRSLEDGSRRSLMALAAVNLAGVYTLYFFAVLVLLEGMLVVGLLVARRERRLLPAVCWLLSTPLLLVPWLAYFRMHAIRFAGDPSPPLTWSEFAQASWGELMLGIDTGVQRYTILLAVLGVAAAAVVTLSFLGFSLDARHDKGGAWHGKGVLALWLALVAAGLPLAAYGVTLLHGLFFSPEYQTRYDLPALPALLILLAWSMSRLPKPALAAVFVLFAGAAVFSLPRLYDARHRTDDYQSLARFVQAYERPGDAIVFDPDKNFHLFLLDYRGHLPWDSIPLGQTLDAAYTDRLFSSWTGRHQALWLLQEAGGHDSGAEHPVRDWLQAHLHASLQLAIGDRLLTLYEPAGAAPRSLNPAFAPQFRLAGQPGLAGFDQPLDDVRPGDVLHLAVYGGPVQALDFGGRKLLPIRFPGRSDFAVPIPAGAASGRQPISVELPGGEAVPLSTVYVEARPSPQPAELPPLELPVGRGFGGQALLTSFSLRPATPIPGGELTVELQWRALEPFSQNYTVFVHLLDAANHVVAQHDAQPQAGQMPTVGWQPGQIIDDPYTLPLPVDLPGGQYHIEAGMYLQATGERLRLSDAPAQDHLILGDVQIR